ncbi:hypothetical protein COM71_24265 [Priestia megaterium]|uniref:hypothetical protein n=1 Tax=Priestia megaterium TaxID=1404 RepID=UPI000BECD1A2|nr:hypothetical protein [Priestia megaterium]PEE43832.1 hypothetical protein COM71_24265 [Priestia megaterium]
MYHVGNSVEQVFGGAIIKQGDRTPLGFNFRDENGELVSLLGSTVDVKLANRQGVVLSTRAIISDEYTATFSIGASDITGAGDMRIEFTVNYPSGVNEKFPSDDWQRLRITSTLDDLGKTGVAYITFEKMTKDFQTQFNSFKLDVSKETENQKKRVDDLINSTPQPSEVVDARGDEKTLKTRIDNVEFGTDSKLAQLKKENQRLVKNSTATAISPNAAAPKFTRATTRDYKGRTYGVNQPIYDMGGLLVDPSFPESLAIPTLNVLDAQEGTVEIGIIPIVLADTVNYCRIDYPTTGRFLLFVNAAGKISFSIDEWGGASISTSNGVAKVNEPFTAALRWNHKAKEYSLFVNGKKIGVNYYDKTVKGDFGSTMSVIHNYVAVVTKLRFSNIARPDKELKY